MCFPFAIMRVRERSMEPSLKDGDYIIVSRWAKCGPNDIVVAKGTGMLLVKRIAKVQGGRYHLSGDNRRESKDSIVGKDRIIGKVLFKA